MGVAKINRAGQKSYNAIAQEVGTALDIWSQVEHALSSVFQRLAHIPDEMTAHAVMASIISFETRLSVCNTLVRRSDLPDHRKEYWNSLFNRLSKKYKKRHEIAHYTIAELTYGSGTSDWKLVPFFSVGAIALKGHPDQLDTLTAAEIKSRGDLFWSLETELRWFEAELLLHEGLLEANRKQEPDRARELRIAADQTPTIP